MISRFAEKKAYFLFLKELLLYIKTKNQGEAEKLRGRKINNNKDNIYMHFRARIVVRLLRKKERSRALSGKEEKQLRRKAL